MIAWKTICAGLLAGSLLFGTAAAAELPAPDDQVWTETVIDIVKFDSINGWDEVLLFESSEPWRGTKYGDQLTGLAAEFYQRMEPNFPDGWTETEWDDKKTALACKYTYTNTYASFEEARVEGSAWAQNARPEAFLACYAFTHDHPEYFWIRTAVAVSYTRSTTNNTSTVEMEMGFTLVPPFGTKAEVESQRARVEAAVNQVLQEASGMDTIEKLAYFDNWLAANNKYNSDAAANPKVNIEKDSTPWSAMGALLPECSPVCEGYAKTFQWLCHESGIPCTVISNDSHMWNAVQLDGVWYLCDPTFDDPVISPSGNSNDYSSRVYFLTADLSKHQPSMGSLNPPEITGSDYFDTHWCQDDTNNGNYWAAGYNSRGAMLECKACPVIQWAQGQRVIAPQFSRSAASTQLFHVNDSWQPLEAKKVLTSP